MDEGSDDRHELALRASNEGVWDWDLGTGEIDYTGRVREFLGYGPEEMPHLFRDMEFVHPDDRAELERVLEGVLREDGEILLACEPRFRAASGEWRWLRLRGMVVRGDEGAVTRIAGSVIDISKRKVAEEALEEERHLMRLLIDNVPLNVYFKDLESRFTLVNESQVRFFGEENAEEMVGKTDHDFMEPERADRLREDEMKIIESGEPIFGFVEPVAISDHEEAWFIASKMPLRDLQGNIQGTFGVSNNVTELVTTQRTLAAVASKLQERNGEIEEELSLARQVQQALLPREYPTIPPGVAAGESRVRMAHRYLPISGLAGDFLEVYQLSDTQVGLFICDVMGHGVRSAVIVSMLRGLAERAVVYGEEPARFLTELNHGLSRILSKANVTMFATAAFMVADFGRGVLRFSSAGHPAGIMTGPGGTRRMEIGKGGPGPALGLFGGAKYGSQVVPLAEVERVLLFTDGIFEVENTEQEAFGEQRLVEVVDGLADKGIEELLDGVLERVRAFAGSGKFDDDVCLVGMEVVR